MSKNTVPVIAINSGKVTRYESVRAAGRALGNNGKTAKDKVSKLCANGGGYVGKTYVANGANYTG